MHNKIFLNILVLRTKGPALNHGLFSSTRWFLKAELKPQKMESKYLRTNIYLLKTDIYEDLSENISDVSEAS